jgi:hypothetical protein
MKRMDRSLSPPSRPTYVRLELTNPDQTIPETLRPLVGTSFQESHDTLIRSRYLGIITKNSYRKACEVNRRKLPKTTLICECSFTPNPCHKCHSIPIPAGSSISHGDWNWNRLVRRRLPTMTSQPTWSVNGDQRNSLPSHLILESEYGRWDDDTLFTYQTKAIRNPQKKWEYALMSIWNVTDLLHIPSHHSQYHTRTVPNLDLIESELRLFQQPDTRFIEWVIRNEI